MYKTNYLIKILALLVAVNVLINISVFRIELTNLYYIIPIIVLLIILVISKKPKINYLLLWLFVACVISIFVNDIPYFFYPRERLLVFFLIIALIGPFLFTKRLNLFKWQLFKSINILVVLFIMLSFLGLIFKSPIFYAQEGFVGVFNHSMMLGPMAAISTLTCINWGSNSTSNKKKLCFGIMAGISFVICVTSGSRAALSAVILSSLFFYFKVNQNQIKKFAKIVLIIIGLGVLSFSFWEQYTYRLTGKFEYSQEQGDIAFSRLQLWERRLFEFKSSPLFGIGFSNDSEKTITDFYKGEGQIEPGSSWLVVLSMLGIFGFIPFVLLIGLIFHFFYRSKLNFTNFNYLGALVLFFVIHMFAEGYVLSAGSGLFFYFWLLLGISDQVRKEIEDKSIVY